MRKMRKHKYSNKIKNKVVKISKTKTVVNRKKSKAKIERT